MMAIRRVFEPALAERGRSPARPGLSRLPRWVTVLGLVFVLGELAGAAALLAAGPQRGTGPQRVTGPHGGAAAHGPAQRVVLRVDGVPLPHPTCIPLPQAPCGPEIAYGTGTGAFTSVQMPASLPFVRTIRVEAGQSVRLNAGSDTHARITCSITVDGKVLSRTSAFTLSPDFTAHGNASCHSTIPASGTGAARRTAVLRVDAVPGAACRQAPSGCGPGVDYTTSAGDAMNFKAAVPFIAEIPEPADGIVTLKAIGGQEPVTCSVSVDGKLLSHAMTPASREPGRETVCQATIPR